MESFHFFPATANETCTKETTLHSSRPPLSWLALARFCISCPVYAAKKAFQVAFCSVSKRVLQINHIRITYIYLRPALWTVRGCAEIFPSKLEMCVCIPNSKTSIMLLTLFSLRMHVLGLDTSRCVASPVRFFSSRRLAKITRWSQVFPLMWRPFSPAIRNQISPNFARDFPRWRSNSPRLTSV